MGVRIFSQFCTSVFCEVPCIYKTGRLWKPANSKLGALAVDDAIYAIPDDAANVSIRECKLLDNVFLVHGVTESGYTEPMASITIPLIEMKDHNEVEISISEGLKKNFVDLSEEFDVEIIVTTKPIYSKSEAEKDFPLYVHMLGLESHIATAELHLWSLIELYQNFRDSSSHLFIECVDLEAFSLLPAAVGVDMANLKHISTTYKTEVHVPPLMFPYISADNDKRKADFCPQLFFSGKTHSLVLAAKRALLDTVERSKSSNYYRRFTDVSPGKLLFIQKYYQSELNRLMIKYQSFVRVTNSYVEFQSPSMALLESLSKVFTINVLHQILEIQINLEKGVIFTDDVIESILVDDEGGPIMAVQLSTLKNQLILIGNHSAAPDERPSDQLDQNSNQILFHLSRILKSLPRSSLKQLKAIFQIHIDYEEFISGKKNGKLTRIMELAPCLIKLEKLEEDDNMFLSLIADSISEFCDAFLLVINELPAEESFFIPEVYHRPVIGAGGSVIQATMKKYNVFVQFSNSFFLPQNELSHIRYDNVIIRCPYKNASGISLAKKELNHLARVYGRLQPRTLLKFSPGQYRHMLTASAPHGVQTIGTIEKNYNVYIMFPFEEPSEGYLLEIRGNEDNSMQAAKELMNTSFGIEREFKLNKAIELNDEIYNSIIIPFKYAMEIEMTIAKDIIRLTHNQGNDNLGKAVEILSDFLNSRKLKIVSKEIIKDFVVKRENPENENKNILEEASNLTNLRNLQLDSHFSPIPLIDTGVKYLQRKQVSPAYLHNSYSRYAYGYEDRYRHDKQYFDSNSMGYPNANLHSNAYGYPSNQ